MIFIIILITAAIFFLFTTIYAGIIAAPFAATPKKYIREGFKIANLKPGEKFCDLGCGDGRALIIASKEFGAESIGFELSYPFYIISKVNILFNGISQKAKVSWSNFYKENLGEADVIFCWLTPKAFPNFIEKFNNELKTGTRVIVFSSPLEFWQPDQVLEFYRKDWLGVHRSKLFLYTKK